MTNDSCRIKRCGRCTYIYMRVYRMLLLVASTPDFYLIMHRKRFFSRIEQVLVYTNIHTHTLLSLSVLKNAFITVDILPNRSEYTYICFDHITIQCSYVLLYCIQVHHNRAHVYGTFIQYIIIHLYTNKHNIILYTRVLCLYSIISYGYYAVYIISHVACDTFTTRFIIHENYAYRIYHNIVYAFE